ncbi:MAG: hypothetical protein ACYCO5_02335 [Acidobacteriaceae bacterium]
MDELKALDDNVGVFYSKNKIRSLYLPLISRLRGGMRSETATCYCINLAAIDAPSFMPVKLCIIGEGASGMQRLAIAREVLKQF